MTAGRKRDLTKYVEKLRALYAQLLEERDSLESTGLHEDVADAAGDASRHDNHPADVGTDLYLRERDSLMEQNLEYMLEQCQRALQKVEEGTYGYSDISGEFIGEERLDAIPYATLTREEQERVDAS
jgi:RNA polymerase-binding transcription factor DksA